MNETGLIVSPGEDMTRIQVTCPHQSGMLYVVPAERSWVCSADQVPSHALAGFFRELLELRDPRVAELMQQWGIYYRQLPLDSQEGAEGGASTPAETNPGKAG